MKNSSKTAFGYTDLQCLQSYCYYYYYYYYLFLLQVGPEKQYYNYIPEECQNIKTCTSIILSITV